MSGQKTRSGSRRAVSETKSGASPSARAGAKPRTARARAAEVQPRRKGASTPRRLDEKRTRDESVTEAGSAQAAKEPREHDLLPPDAGEDPLAEAGGLPLPEDMEFLPEGEDDPGFEAGLPVLETEGLDGDALEDDARSSARDSARSTGTGRTGREPKLLPGGGALVRLDPLGRYLAEVRRYPPLDREEEIQLTRHFRDTRDPETAQRLVTSNLVLVVKIARMFRRAVVNVLDLIQEGNVGLLHALDRFDPDVGVRFSTYASWWIRAYILKYLLDNTRLVRVGTTNARRKLLYNLNREKRRLEAAGFTAGPRLLAEKFGVSERDVVDVEQALRGGDVPLDAPVGEDGTATRGDLMPSEAPSVEDEVARRELKELLDAKLAVFRAGLSEKESAILDARLLSDDPATLQEIGDRYHITREAVRQVEKRLTDRLREYLTSELGAEAVLQFRRR